MSDPNEEDPPEPLEKLSKAYDQRTTGLERKHVLVGVCIAFAVWCVASRRSPRSAATDPLPGAPGGHVSPDASVQRAARSHMAGKKKTKKPARKGKPPVPGIPREHTMIDARAERERLQRQKTNGKI